ncbi:MAG TPA: PPC domain-containing protein [Pirellulaceae bacterium]|nr:PPC domain-containing protein [Pirellulaceae bacterium]
MSCHTFRALVGAALLTCCGTAWADLPTPRLDRIYPLGGAAGGSLEVEILGGDMEAARLAFDHPGITSEPVAGKERRYTINIAADVPAGTYDARLLGKYGVSNPRLFAVSRGLVDVTNKEPNNNADQAQVVAVNSAINGQSDGNDQDVYRVTLRKDQRLTIDCQATKLESQLDGTLFLMNAAGATLASSGDYHGRDPFLDFIAPTDGDYYAVIHDLSYRGGHPYRLIISDRPQVENVFPRVVQAGQNVELTVLGRNLGPGAKPSTWQVLERPLDELRLSIAAPTDLLTHSSYRFLEHPTDHSVEPTAATCTANGYQVRLTPQGDALNPTSLLVVDTPVTLEAEPNDQQTAPQALALPLVVSGRFDRPRDADWYSFETDAAGPYSFDVYCERLAGQADPYLVVVDSKGARVQELDDYGHRVKGFDGHLRDPSAMVNLNAKQKYFVLVQDRYQRGGARYQYVLQVHAALPDFHVATMHHQNNVVAGTNIWRGGATYLDVIVHQRDGYNGPITLTAENLPAGVHCLPTVLNNNNSGVLVLWADENAAPHAGPIKLWATGQQGDKQLVREVRSYSRVWNDGGSRPARELYLGVSEQAPYSLKFAAEQIDVEAGQSAEVKLTLTRLWPEFTEPLTILPLSFPGNFKLGNQQFSGNATEITFKIEVQNNTRPGDYTLAVLGQGQVPFTKDAEGKDRKNTLVSLPSRPFTLRVSAPPKPAK